MCQPYYLLGSPPYSSICLQTNEIPREASSIISLIVPWGKFLDAYVFRSIIIRSKHHFRKVSRYFCSWPCQNLQQYCMTFLLHLIKYTTSSIFKRMQQRGLFCETWKIPWLHPFEKGGNISHHGLIKVMKITSTHY